MATDICSEISSFSFSPRISFSYDLNQRDQQDHSYNDQHLDHKSISDNFNFCVIKNDSNFSFEFSSADELFSEGKILPIQIKNTNHHQKPDLLKKNDNIVTKKVQLKEFLSSSYDSDDDKEENDSNKAKSSQNDTSFWKFRRSSSLNFEKIKSLHFISRSNSTGSTQPNKKPSLKKHKSLDSISSSSSSSSSSCRGNSNHGYKRSSSFSSHCSNNNSDVNLWSKSFPRKNNNCNGGSQYYGNYANNNGVRVSPVLNLPHPYISKVTIISFFGFGSLFCNGKVRKKK